MPRDAVSRTANVGTMGINGLSDCCCFSSVWVVYHLYNWLKILGRKRQRKIVITSYHLLLLKIRKDGF